MKKMFEQDFEQVMAWFKKAAEQGDVDAQCNLGFCYYTGRGVEQDFVQAMQWFTKAAIQGSAVAQNYLGECYYYGKGVEQDFVQAMQWFTKAAEQNEANAQYNLGMCYSLGRDVEQDFKQAVTWFTKAANQDDEEAQYRLGVCYFNGEGVERNYKQAIIWFTKAAEQGKAGAQYALGKCYSDGYGVEQDYKQAIIWFTAAAKQGNANAGKVLKDFKEISKNRYLLPTERTEVFISYSSKDKRYVDEMKPFLNSLERNHGIAIWHMEMLTVGDMWEKTIRQHMSATRVAIFLVSPHFLVSPFVRDGELPNLLQAAKNGNVTIMWIPVSDSQVKDTRIKGKDNKGNVIEMGIADYQAVGDSLKPLNSMTKNERNKIYHRTCENIKHCFNFT